MLMSADLGNVFVFIRQIVSKATDFFKDSVEGVGSFQLRIQHTSQVLPTVGNSRIKKGKCLVFFLN